MEFEVLIMVLLLGVEVFRPLRELRALLHDGMLAESAARQVFSVLDARPQVHFNAGQADVELTPRLLFDDVRFAYEQQPEAGAAGRGVVLDGLSFDIAPGERVGLVGSSGGGKSTIARLLLRFYDADSGSIRLGGKDIRELSLDQLRRQFAVVSQDTHLFHGTVRENLLMGDPDASDEALVQAARSANAAGFIEALPDGYDTVIGERGLRLSGGQKQRIAIARAILRDAPILILDEALSSVDARNEAVIQKAFDRLMQGRTTLIMAHRLSSVIGCDRILVLDQGRVVEQGTHAELMACGGVYAKLMASQVAERQDPGPHGVLDAEFGVGETDRLPDAPPEALLAGASASRDVDLQSDVLLSDAHSWGRVLLQLLSFVAPWKGRLVSTFALGVLRVLSFIGVSLVSALAAVAVKNGADYSNWLLALGIIAVAAAVLHWLESWLAHDMAFRMLTEMRLDLFRKLDSLAPAFMLRRRSGDLINLATHDIEMVEYFFAHTITPLFVAVLVPGLVLILLGGFDVTLALGLLPFLALVGLMPVVMRARIDRLAGRARQLLGALSAHTVESLQGLGELLAYQATAHRRAQFVRLIEQHHRERIPFFKEMVRQAVITDLLTVVAGLSVILISVTLVASGKIDAVYLPLLALASMAAFLPVIEISDAGRQLAETFAATNRLIQVQDSKPAVSDDALRHESGPEALPETGALDIEFSQLVFRYDSQDAPALDGMSLKIPAASTVAIVGASGAGKSTIAHLLLRFWDPQQGQIRIAGHDIRRLSLDHLRLHVALVAQDTYLFNDSLRANLLMARPDASDAELVQAVQRAELSEFVARLPQGLDTRVGERGYALSGGQRQRVSIARAFLRDAPILVLDEATSHLDALSEQAVHRALKELMQNRTTLVIAHRLATVRDADRIVVMSGGRLLEQGTHRELLEKRAAYAQLLHYQMTSGEVADGALAG
jgi:ATP-binding cassette subfamily C protein CydCD